jgi:hypothetical protein
MGHFDLNRVWAIGLRQLMQAEEKSQMHCSKLLGLAGCILLGGILTGIAHADTIYANDDSFVRVNNSSNWDNQGLFIKQNVERDLYLEFTLGNQAVTQAKLKVYQTLATCDGQLIKWKGEEWSFDETTLNWNNQANASAWHVLPTFTTLVNTVQWYEIDIKSFYNDHLGKTVSFFAWSGSQTSDQYGNIFEDRENSKGSGNPPYIETTSLVCVTAVAPGTDAYREAFGSDPVQNVVYTMSNNGTAPVSYTVQKVPDDASTAWLTLDKSGGGPLNNGQSEAVTATISTSGLADGRHTCQLQFANNCSPPVTETRTVTLDYSATWTPVGATGDTFTRSNEPTTNYDNQGIQVKQYYPRDGWIEFNTGAQQITLAELWMYQTLSSCDAQTIELRGAAYTFDETTLTWDTQPAADAWQLLGTWDAPSGNRWYTLNITDFYNAHLNTSITMRVRCIWQGNDETGQTFEDRENTMLSGNTPYLKRGSAIACGSTVAPSATQNSAAPRNQPASPPSFAYTVNNAGTVTINYTVHKDPDDAGTAWLSLDKTGGSIAAVGSDVVTATIVSTNLSDGLHSVDLVFTDNCNPANAYRRTIQLSITACQTQVTPVGDQYRTVIGSAGLLNSVDYTIRENGGDPVSYTVQKIPDDATTAWLTLSKMSGGPLAYGQSDQVTASTNATGLAPGVYSCDLQFTNTCSPSVAVTRTVRLRVLPMWGTFSPDGDTYGDSGDPASSHDDRGILIKQDRRRDGWLQFTLGSSPSHKAKLFMYQTLSPCDGQTVQLNAAEYSFDEVTLTFNNQPNTGSWTLLGTWDAPSGNRWYDLDITDFYNTHLNKTISVRLLVTHQDLDETGQLFEDRENSLGTGNMPYIDPEVTPWPDADRDGDVDQADFAVLQSCFTDDGGVISDTTMCKRFNRNASEDDDVDSLDVIEFEKCATGPGIPLDPDNLPPGCGL